MANPSQNSAPDFILIEDAGTLEIAYDGRPLDLEAIGVLHLNIQDIIDRVAYTILRSEDLVGPYGQRRRSSTAYRAFYGSRVVRAQPTKISIGSFYATIAFLIPVVLSDPDVRAVLQNLAGSVVWSIATSRYARWCGESNKSPERLQAPRYPRIDVGANIRDIAMALAENGGGALKFRDGNGFEVEIRANGRRESSAGNK